MFFRRNFFQSPVICGFGGVDGNSEKAKKDDDLCFSCESKGKDEGTEKHYIPNYPNKLYIYKLPASRYWWVRYFVNNNAVRKSTKTESKREAIEFAKTFYDTVTYNQRHGINATLSATSFAACLREMLKADKAKLDRGEISKITYDNSVYRYEKSITPFFGKME